MSKTSSSWSGSGLRDVAGGQKTLGHLVPGRRTLRRQRSPQGSTSSPGRRNPNLRIAATIRAPATPRTGPRGGDTSASAFPFGLSGTSRDRTPGLRHRPGAKGFSLLAPETGRVPQAARYADRAPPAKVERPSLIDDPTSAAAAYSSHTAILILSGPPSRAATPRGAVEAQEKAKVFGLNNLFLAGVSYDHGS